MTSPTTCPQQTALPLKASAVRLLARALFLAKPGHAPASQA
ncbi:hypothetical protein [Pseudarthrobacter sp. C4D7]|nr:hypothetical protein [Pseudarthrobacter sp. C4D7]